MSQIENTTNFIIGSSKGDLVLFSYDSQTPIRQIRKSNQTIVKMFPLENEIVYLSHDFLTSTSPSTTTFTVTSLDWANKWISKTNKNAYCESKCPESTYPIQSVYECDSCPTNCLTCTSATTCSKCKTGYFVEEGASCVDRCSNSNLWADVPLGQCVVSCEKDVYNVKTRQCEDSKLTDTSYFGLDIALKIVSQSTSSILLQFDRDIIIHKNFMPTEEFLLYCISAQMTPSANSTLQYNFSSSGMTRIFFNFEILSSVAIKSPTFTFTYNDQKCFTDLYGIPLKNSLIADGHSIVFPFVLQNSDPELDEQIDQTEKIIKGVTDSAAAVGFPLVLTNLMFVFWLLINVFQIINLLAFLEIDYPKNVISFFRAFKSFNLGFLPTLGLSDKDEDIQTESNPKFLGMEIREQIPSIGFEREGYTSSFVSNGLKFFQMYLFGLLLLVLIRYLAKQTKVDPYDKTTQKGFFSQMFATIYQKIEYSIFIGFHQTSALSFSLFVYLQVYNPNFNSTVNVVSLLLTGVAVAYFWQFLYWVYKQINLPITRLASKEEFDQASSQEKQEFEQYKIRYDILYLGVNFQTYYKKNYHAIIFIRNSILPLFVVFFHKIPVFSLIVFLIFFGASFVYSAFYKPFNRNFVSYLAALNELIMVVVVILILIINAKMKSDEDGIIEQSAINESVNIGWGIIGLLLWLFFMNIIVMIGMEWDNIKEAFKTIKRAICGGEGSENNDEQQPQARESQSNQSPDNLDDSSSIQRNLISQQSKSIMDSEQLNMSIILSGNQTPEQLKLSQSINFNKTQTKSSFVEYQKKYTNLSQDYNQPQEEKKQDEFELEDDEQLYWATRGEQQAKLKELSGSRASSAFHTVINVDSPYRVPKQSQTLREQIKKESQMEVELKDFNTNQEQNPSKNDKDDPINDSSIFDSN